MQEVDINTLVNKYNYLNKNIPNDIIIVGKIDRLNIEYKYDQLGLLKVECDELYYKNQEGESIKNHILPNSLKELDCDSNQLTSLPKLPDSLEELYCRSNKLTLLSNLPNSLKVLYCNHNQLISLPELPNSLKILHCNVNQLTSFANAQLPNSLKELDCSNNKLTSFSGTQLPNSLEELYCSNNKLTSFANTQLPNSLRSLYCCNNDIKNIITLPNCLYRLNFKQKNDIYLKNLPISLKIIICNTMHVEIIEYNENAKDIYNLDTKIYCGDDIITCKNDLEKYMEKLKINKIKSAK